MVTRRPLAASCLVIVLAILATRAPRAASTAMPIAEVRPGMVGIGHTVFTGTRVEEFKAHILGVIENVMGPQRNLILARLEGGPLATTGVIAGMSGSPVFIDGRLVGAVSYSLGSFSKEPIAGITPIAEMTAATTFDRPRPLGARARLDFPLTTGRLTAAFSSALAWGQLETLRPDEARLVGAASIGGLGERELGTLLRPIATPLVMSGFEPDLADAVGAAFRAQGFVPAGGAGAGGRPGEMPFDGPLKPGDAVGVNFVTGDLVMGATGTVTEIDGDRVYAFGHPMYNLGPTEFPMTRAYVYTVLPSLFSSSKLSTTGEVIGTFLQDRATAIAGRLGPGPKLIPVSLTLEAARGAAHTFHFSVVRDPVFTPLMTYTALLSTLSSYERQYGAETYVVQGHADIAGHGSVTFDNIFSGADSPAIGTAAYVVGPIQALLGNDVEAVSLDSLTLSIKSTEEPRTATLERIWIDDQRPRAGRTIPLKVLLRGYRGDEVVRTVPVDIPANATGTVSLSVSDGARLSLAELREARVTQPRTVPQLLRSFNRVRRNNTLYVRLLASDAGAVVNGESLAALPPSVLAVIEADRSGGNMSPLSSATLGEWEIPTEFAVTGARTLTVPLVRN